MRNARLTSAALRAIAGLGIVTMTVAGLFTASGKDFLFERDRKPEVFPIEYSGAVVAPKSTGGAAQIVLD